MHSSTPRLVRSSAPNLTTHPLNRCDYISSVPNSEVVAVKAVQVAADLVGDYHSRLGLVADAHRIVD